MTTHTEVRQLLNAPFEIAPLSAEVVVYGAGNSGRAVGAYLAAAGHRVVAYLDAAGRPGQQVEGVPVHQAAEWPGQRQAAEYDVVVAVHNYGVDMVELLAKLQPIGFRRVLNMVHLHNLFPDDQPWRYWLAPRSFYRRREREIAATELVLGDASSRAWFNQVLTFRLTGDYSQLPAPSPADQYTPGDLPRWQDPMRFIDCGAFNGDTVAALAKVGYAFEAIAAFEPDPGNFAALAQRVGSHGPAFCFPCGVADATRQVRFQAGNGMASHESNEGNVIIQCVSIDEALAGFRPTYLKMDIEGAEPEALKGARDTIARSRPALAISLYHYPQHLWEIPLLIAGWNLGYRLEIRGHSHSSFDTVLYALPPSGPGAGDPVQLPANCH